MSVVYSAGVGTGLRYLMSDLPPHMNHETLESAIDKQFPDYQVHWFGNAWSGKEDDEGLVILHKASVVYYRDINYTQGAEDVDTAWIYDLGPELQEIADVYGLENTSGVYFFASVG